MPVVYFWRSMIANLDAWVRSNTAPPASQYAKISDNTLVPLDRYAFPHIPGVQVPQEANRAYRIDFGPNWQVGVLRKQPPQVGQAYPILVPQVDRDGNEVAGVRLPEIRVPLATYTGWNLRDPLIGAPDQRVSFEGSYIPFPRTMSNRKKAADPRRSIAERYSGRAEYLARYGEAIDELIKQRWILPEDRGALFHRGEQEWDQALDAKVSP
jgi:hypothetical protein